MWEGAGTKVLSLHKNIFYGSIYRFRRHREGILLPCGFLSHFRKSYNKDALLVQPVCKFFWACFTNPFFSLSDFPFPAFHSLFRFGRTLLIHHFMESHDIIKEWAVTSNILPQTICFCGAAFVCP